MAKSIQRIAVTGGCGQVAYSLLFRIASGELLGKDQPIALHILEKKDHLPLLQGVVMELEDCCFPLLQEIRIGSDPFELFGEVSLAILVGAKPRGPGMERKDLLQENGKIFVEQGKALNQSASKEVKVIVVGNPCNTNCLIALYHAPNIPSSNFHAMMRLDQNRASAQLAKKAKVGVDAISCMTIWGNHSSTQVPDFEHARISGKTAEEVLQDRSWLEKDFFELIQKRGASIIAARGKSSAASAAQSIMDAMHSLFLPSKGKEWFSSATLAKGNPYGIREDLVFSFPCKTTQMGECQIVSHLSLSSFLKEKIKKSEQELLEERDFVLPLLK